MVRHPPFDAPFRRGVRLRLDRAHQLFPARGIEGIAARSSTPNRRPEHRPVGPSAPRARQRPARWRMAIGEADIPLRAADVDLHVGDRSRCRRSHRGRFRPWHLSSAPAPCGRCRSHPGRGAIAASRADTCSGPSRPTRRLAIPQHRRHRSLAAPGQQRMALAPAAAGPAAGTGPAGQPSWPVRTGLTRSVEVPVDRPNGASPTLPPAGVQTRVSLVFFRSK